MEMPAEPDAASLRRCRDFWLSVAMATLVPASCGEALRSDKRESGALPGALSDGFFPPSPGIGAVLNSGGRQVIPGSHIFFVMLSKEAEAYNLNLVQKNIPSVISFATCI